MACQNCGSNDIVAIQGQHYCINCGQLVVESKTKESVGVAVAKKPPRVIEARAPETTKRSKPSSPSRKGNVIKPLRPIVKDEKPEKSADAPDPDSKPRSTDGIARKEADQPKPAILDLKNPAHDKSKPAKAPAHESISKTWHGLAFLLRIALVTALPLGVLTALGLFFNLDTDILVYGFTSMAVLVSMTLVLAEAASIYGKSRVLDGRPTPQRTWWLAARYSYLNITNLNLAYAIAAMIVGVAAYGIWQLALGFPEGSTYIRAGVLLIVNSLLAWLLIMIVILRRLAIVSSVVGGLGAGSAISAAWKLYRRHRLGILAAGLETGLGQLVVLAVVSALGLGAYYIATGPLATWNYLVYGTAGALTVVLVMMWLLELEAGPWLKRYRTYATELTPMERVQLLNGGSRQLPTS